MLTVIIFLAVLSALVLVHELGHFWAARYFKVGAEEFGLGMPPRLFGFYRGTDKSWHFFWGSRDLEKLIPSPKNTVYSLNWLPLGGFVRIKGQDGDSGDQDSFASKKIWQRFVILAAGVTMNVIFAGFLFSASMMIGAPQSVTEGGEVKIVEVLTDSPADKAGFKSGDVLKAINDQSLDKVELFQEAVGVSAGQEVLVTIERAGEEQRLAVVPEGEEGRGLIGVSLDQIKMVRYSFFSAIYEGFKYSIQMLGVIILAFIYLIRDLFVGTPVGDSVGGPIMIAQMTGQVARFGFTNLMNFTALLSLNLAVLNFFPFPALDGGRAFLLLVEKLRGRPLKKEIEAWLNNAGFFLLMALIVFVTYKDILRIFQ